MGRRRSPYLTKTEAGKNRRNKNTSPVTDYTSQDFIQTRHDYTNKYKNYKHYFTSDIYDRRLKSPKRKGSGESYTFDDYTTSGISYDELKKRPNDLIYSVSTSDYVYESPEKYNNISSFRDYDHSYPKGSRSREKKRLRLMKDSNKNNYPDLIDESEPYLDRDRRYRSPRSRYYHDLIHEEPEKEFDYEQYFEKTRLKVGSSPKRKGQDQYDGRYEKQTKLQSRIPNQRMGYQVYAYQDPTHQEDIFKSKNHPGDLSLSSEVEIKTHEYPVLAFKDAKSGKKDSDMVYLPIIVLDKKSGKSRPEKSADESIYQTNKDNFQIYAANLQEQKNIFQQFGGHPNIIKSKEPTSRPQTGFGVEATSGMRYADSLLGTIIDEAVDTDYRNEDRMIETIADQRIPFTTGRRPFTYQVDVDISPNGPTGSMKDKDKQSSHIRNSSVNDPLHDGYPVTKDYIKVSDSKQNRKSLAPLISKDVNNPSSVMGQKISEERKSNTIKEEAQSVKLIDDKTISMSIAQSKETPATKSIMRNPSQVSLDEQPLNKDFSSMRQSVALGTKQNSRASHIGPAEKGSSKGKPATKMSVLNEETSQDLRKSMKTGTAQRQSVVRSSKVASSGLARNTTGAESNHNLLHDSDRKSMKPGMHSEQTADRRSKVHTTPSTLPPVSDDQKSVLHSQTNQDRKSTVAHMVDTSSPSSQNVRTSHADSRRSAVEGRRSKVQTMQQTPSSPVSDHRKSVLHSQSGQDRKSTAVQMANTHPPASQDIRGSQAQSRQSAVAPRPSAANLSGDNRQSMKSSAPRQSQKAVPASVGKKSLVQSSAHHNTHIVAGNNNSKLSHKVDKQDSEDALLQFTKDVFQVDLGAERKISSHKNEEKKPTASVVRQSHGAESKHQLRQSAVGQSQNALGNVELSHEQIGDNSAGVSKAPTVQEGKRKTRSLRKTTSNMFRTLSKIGKKKSKEQVNKPYISTGSPTGSKKSEEKSKPAKTTQDNDDSHFVRSIEPTVTQYKKEQNKAHTLTKSKSKPDTKVPKEKKSLTRLFSRSKSKINNESGDDSKKKKKNKSRSMLGILKRGGSKSSEVLTTPPAERVEPTGDDKQTMECECFAHYVQNTRVCAYFFLGTTLHEQIMNIIKVFLGGS